ncbi:hypothetical protein C8F04DRAFT_1254358 [Mycena alexandri]|uniref:Uncharacterized protein n=1 Tax=Mycena alexandri TaxID=1745969 RepID=A0AAD6TA94_9AGAR|nr:hypothetical protein C8F04DRAFT_1254358 [Mycena alexandri]
MLTLLALQARIAGDEVLIVAPAGPINTSIGGQKYLKKYGSWFQINNHKRLYNVLYRDPNHWTTSLVDFEKKQVKYGDDLKWKRPVTYFDGLQNWIEKYHGAEFVVSDNLMCTFQTDGFNCPIIAVDTIAHNEFGDALWTKEKAKAMRMKAFCNILKHSLSVEDQGSQPTVVDLTDLAENLLAVDVDINDELLSTVPMAMHTELPNSELQISTEGVDDIELGIVILQSLHNVSTAEHSGEFGETIKESVDTTRAPAEFGHSLADIEMQEAVPIEPPTGRGFKRDVDQVEDMEKCKQVFGQQRMGYFEDAKHGRKTFRNNAVSGARGLVLGNFVVYFEQMYTLEMEPNSLMHPRDWKNRDLMDDAAAACLSSADTLEQAAQDPTKNLGLFVYLFIFGDLIDAYQSRTMSHHERAKIAIRTRLSLQTWHLYLQKAGYSEARHFKIQGGLRHIRNPSERDPGLNCHPPRSSWRQFMPAPPLDFTLQEAILIVPKLRAKMQAAVLTSLKATDFKKQASGYSHTYFTKDDINFGLLGQYPTDLELSAAYEVAAEENNCLWSLLGIHPVDISNAFNPGSALIAQPAPDPDFQDLYLDEDGAAVECTAAEELQRVVGSLKTASNISRAGDKELDACVMASVALAMEELAKIDDLPESDPERFAEIQKEIVHAMTTQPTAFVALLQGMAASAHSNSTHSDLAPLVTLRREHQTREEKWG